MRPYNLSNEILKTASGMAECLKIWGGAISHMGALSAPRRLGPGRLPDVPREARPHGPAAHLPPPGPRGERLHHIEHHRCLEPGRGPDGLGPGDADSLGVTLGGAAGPPPSRDTPPDSTPM